MTSVEHSESVTRKLYARFLYWYRENRQATRDLIVLLVLSILTYCFVVRIDLMAGFHAYARRHEGVELDELILTLGLISSLFVPIFALRRWSEATHRLKQANTDNLTDLFNRHKGLEILEYEMSRALRYRRPLSIIMLDVDSFKSINDTYGHLAGDQTLKAVADIARETVRTVDNLIRWGGEEFIVLMPDTELEAAVQVAERLREAIATAPIHVPNAKLQITASFGIAAKDQNTPDVETLLARADQAMYIAKYLGRNRVARSK